MSAASFEEPGQGGPDGVDGALHIDVDHLLELVGRQVEEGPVGADAGVDDEDVEPAEAIDGGGDHRLERRRIAHVTRLRDRTGDARSSLRSAKPGRADALRRQGLRNGRADAATRAGDQRHPAVQPVHGTAPLAHTTLGLAA